jgi:hypothetical protein
VTNSYVLIVWKFERVPCPIVLDHKLVALRAALDAFVDVMKPGLVAIVHRHIITERRLKTPARRSEFR